MELPHSEFITAMDWCIEMQYGTIWTNIERQYQECVVHSAGVELPHTSPRQLTEGCCWFTFRILWYDYEHVNSFFNGWQFLWGVYKHHHGGEYLFRWFKFTLKPPNSMACRNFFLAIWDTSHWNLFVKFRLNLWHLLGPFLVNFDICQFLVTPGPFE